MKHLILKLIFVVVVVLGISSFVALENNNTNTNTDEIGNTRFNAEMDNGFEEREARF